MIRGLQVDKRIVGLNEKIGEELTFVERRRSVHAYSVYSALSTFQRISGSFDTISVEMKR